MKSIKKGSVSISRVRELLIKIKNELIGMMAESNEPDDNTAGIVADPSSHASP